LVPPSLHFKTPHTKVDWASLPLEIVTETRPLPDRGRPSVVGVTSQGVSSSNVHVVLSQFDPALRRAAPEAAKPGRPHILLLSAPSEAALGDLVRAYVAFLSPGGNGHGMALRDITHTAALRREHHGNRLAIVGATHDELVTKLRAHLAGQAPASAPGGDRDL